MRSYEELLEVLDRVCADVAAEAPTATEVPERLIVVASDTVSVAHGGGIDLFQDGGVIAFVNDSGVPFVEQSERLVARAARLRPEAVLLAGSAIMGRPGGTFRRILAVQLFSPLHGIRTARTAELTPAQGVIESVGPWRESKAGPPIWAEKILAPA